MAPEGKAFALGLEVVGCRLQKISRDLKASLSQKYMLVIWDARFRRASYTCETRSSTCAKVNWKLSCFGDVSCVRCGNWDRERHYLGRKDWTSGLWVAGIRVPSLGKGSVMQMGWGLQSFMRWSCTISEASKPCF